MTAENFGGNSSANTTITKPQKSTATTQSDKSVTQLPLPSATEKQLNNKGIAAVTADYEDDFLRGFNADDREAQARSQTDSNTLPKTTTRSTYPSMWEDSPKGLSNKRITATTMDFGYVNPSPVLRDHIQSIPVKQEIEPVAQTFADVHKLKSVKDDFLRGFNEGYEENETAAVPESRDPNLWDLTVNSFKYGYNDSARGQEAWKSMHGQENELDKYNELLSSDEYNFEADDWWEKMLSGASQQVGQWVRQLTDPETAALAMGSGGMALLAGQAGPQVLLPEEVLTVPTTFALGMKAGNAKTNMEIEGGRAYLEMLNNGVSEETARAIATSVGGINALLETAQLDELLKAYKVLGKAGADDTLMSLLLREITNRTLDTAVETGQEDLQELVTIAGTQLGSKIDNGEWAYSFTDILQRLWDTTKESALTFGLTNIPSTVHNVGAQNRNRIVTESIATASPTFANSKDRLYQNSKMIEPIEGFEDVVVHGDMNGFVFKNADGVESTVSVYEFADILKESGLYNGGDIRLISCETGKSGAIAAQGLANKLGVNVLAPTDVVYVFGDGRMIVSSDGYTNDGEWVVFEPTNRLDGGGK